MQRNSYGNESTAGKSNRTLIIAIIAVVVLIVLIVAIFLLVNRSKQSSAQPSAAPGSPAALAKPKLVAGTYQGCPPSGDGGDPVLNTLKNRIDEGQWQPVTVATILSLTWPSDIERQPRFRWSKAELAEIAQNEGAPVQAEGYLVDAKKMSPETCNCHSVDQVDFHIWMVDERNKTRAQSLVIEVSPRVRAFHPKWTLQNIRNLATRHEKVRISGWLMMDPEHPDQIGKTRGTIWEIHPIMQIETQGLGGSWQPLDNGTTGVSSAPVEAAAATAPPVTPVETATLPPRGNTLVQDNSVVTITTVNFDGARGSAEPDEYVEIKNTGSLPVDITDWALQDAGGRNFYKWESYTMKPGETIRVYTNEVHPESGGFSFESGKAIWANSGDVAELYDVDKQLISRYPYGNKK